MLMTTMRVEARTAQSLTLEQRHSVQALVLSMRLDLIEALRGERYEPHGICPVCSRKMTPVEIIRGFNQDPNDFTTACSACGCRFEPTLICFGRNSRIEIPFYCSIQTLEHLRGKESYSPKYLEREHPAIYRSAIVHHGGIRSAFEKIGIEYPFEEISNWQKKVTPFLGRLPDTVIAESADVKVSAVREMRKKLGICRYTLSMSIDEAEYQ